MFRFFSHYFVFVFYVSFFFVSFRYFSPCFLFVFFSFRFFSFLFVFSVSQFTGTPLLYIFVAEILVKKIKDNDSIRGFKKCNMEKEIKNIQHADDLTLL